MAIRVKDLFKVEAVNSGTSALEFIFEEVRGAATTPNECPTHLEHCDGVVRVGSLCLNHPELLHKHPTHLASSVMVRIV